MASTLPPEKKRRAMKATAAGAAPRRKGGGVGGLGGTGVAHGREDPHYTWNQQLMEACFACDVATVRKLIERGADPVNARELPPPSYYTGPIIQTLQAQQPSAPESGSNSPPPPATDTLSGAQSTQPQNPLTGSPPGPQRASGSAVPPDSLPPLAAMLLSGLNTPAALEVMRELVLHGASVNDVFTFSTPPFVAPRLGADLGDDESSGIAADGNASIMSNSRSKKSISMASEGKNKPQSAGRRKASMSGAVSAGSFGGGVALSGIPGSLDLSPPGAPQQDESATTVGSILHYVVAHGDHAQLTRLLLLAAAPPPSPSSESPLSTSLLSTAQVQKKTEAPNPDDGSPFEHHGDFPIPLPYTLMPAVEAETVVGAVQRQYQLRLSSLADVSLANASTASVSPRATQSRKGRVAGNATSPSRPTPSTTLAPAEPIGPLNATTLASPAVAEGVLAALQQVLRQRQTSTGGYRGLPILMSVYPQRQNRGTSNEANNGEAVDNSRTLIAAGNEAVAAAVAAPPAPCNWWHLASLCDGDNGVSGESRRQRTFLDLELVDSSGRTAATTALEHGDALSVRLLSFFGAHVPFDGQVNASQTRLARACALGDVARVEALLRQGDTITQISADGRYTLVHYAAAQPNVLRTLVEHGLSLEAENAFGDSALASLMRHGTARNDPRYMQTLFTLAAAIRSAATDSVTNPVTANIVNAISSTTATNAVHFAELSTAVHRNMILCPTAAMAALTAGNIPLGTAPGNRRTMGNGNGHNVTTPATTSNGNGNVNGNGSTISGPPTPPPFMGGCEVGTWWSFLPPTVTTAEVLEVLLRAGAMLQGFEPDEELDLPYVQFAERQAALGESLTIDGESESTDGNSDDMGDRNEMEDDDDDDDDDDNDVAIDEDSSRDADDDLERSATVRDTQSNMLLSPQRERRFTPCNERRLRGKQRRWQQRAAVLPARLPMRLTPLQHAIFDYHPELIRRLLVDYRVDPMHRDSQGATALHYAALCVHAPSVLELLVAPQTSVPVVASSKTRAGGGVSSDASNNAPLGSYGTGAPALGIGDTNIDLNAVDMAGRTPLFYAAYVGNTTAVQRLIGFGGATLLCGKADKNGYTPLHIAVQQKHANIVELILRHSNQVAGTVLGGVRGQQVDILSELFSTGTGNSSTGRSSRGTARRNSHRGNHDQGSRGMNRLLVPNSVEAIDPELLANVEAEESVTHMTALEMAVKAHHLVQPLSSASLSEESAVQREKLLKIVALLLGEAQASSLRPSGLVNGGALLHRAVADGAVELVELLLSNYADPNEVDNASETPLFLALRLTAAASGDEPISSELRQQNRRRRASIVRALLQHGSLPHAQSAVHLQTPLHLAASSLADDDEILQLIFYTAPEGSATSAVARRRRHDQHRGQIFSRGSNYTEGSGPRDDPLGGGITGGIGSKRFPSSSGLLSGTGRRAVFERRGQDRRTQQRRGSPSSSLQAKNTSTSQSFRRKPWKGSSVSATESEHGGDPGDLDGFSDDPMLSGGNTYTYRDTRNSSFASVEQASADMSMTQIAGESPLSAGGNRDIACENGSKDEYEEFLESLSRWQCADHLLAPEELWMLTDARGQTPLHVLCSRSSRAHQCMPAVLKLLEDLKTVTCANSAMASVAAGTYDDTRADDHLLALCWRLPDAQGRTPLHIAAQSGFVQAMECILMQAPRTALAVDMQGRTPLHACVLTVATAAAPSAPVASVAAADTNMHAANDEEKCRADEEAAAEYATKLRRMLSLLHQAVAKEISVPLLGLQGTPPRRPDADILPSLAAKTTMPNSDTYERELRVQHTSTERMIIPIVMPSSITAQLQRWQKMRHWGCPALTRKDYTPTGAHTNAPHHLLSSSGSSSTSTLASGANAWKAYVQLPDEQGRTALLLAAEVGNISAARELLKKNVN